MHLRTLTLKGFKSFATSTTLVFEPGINCVVGPNGSGKSNVVDALSWVMGEQGVKNLRGGNMADVIFAGTAKRPALGRAEVSLTIDNSEGVLPIEYSEVTISRTLFRNGGSEYAINGTPCRLLDIQELLSDTGMGKEMHVIIGQGRLDEVLVASPEDRRGFIEEAAGVLKHRRRKEKALRKLEGMRESLTRIEDLAAEVRRQLGPLARQADAARRAQVIQADVRDARSRILADDLAQQQALVEAQAVDEGAIDRRRVEARARVEAARAAVAALENEAASVNPRIAALAENVVRLTSLEERFRSLEQVARERARSLSEPLRGYRGEPPESIRERAQRARAEEDELRERVERDAENLATAIANREAAEDAERLADKKRADVARAIADRRESDARREGTMSAARARLEAAKAELSRVEVARRTADDRAEETAREVSRLEEELVAMDTGNEGLVRAHQEASEVLEAANSRLADVRQRSQAAVAEEASQRARAEALYLSLAPEDATAWAVEAPQVRGLVRDSVTVEVGWEPAAEAALRGLVDGVVVATVDDAVDVIREARSSAAGRLHVVVAGEDVAAGEDAAAEHEAIGGVREGAHEVPERRAELPACPGTAVWACDVVAARGPLADSVRSLLTGVALADGLAAARSLVASGVPVVATTDGDLVTSHSVSGGAASEASILARHAAYEAAVQARDEAAVHMSEAAAAVARCEAERDEARRHHEETGAALTARDASLASISAQLGIMRQTLAAATAEQQRNGTRANDLRAAVAAHEATLDALEADRQAHEEAPEGEAHMLDSLEDEVAACRAATRAARQGETEARLRLRTGEERLRALAGRADGMFAEAERVAERLDREARASVRRGEAAATASRVEQWAQRAGAVAHAHREEASLRRREAEEARETRDRRISDARRQADSAVATLAELDDAAHRHELALASLKMTYEHLAARSRDELGMAAEELIAEYGPHLPVPGAESDVPYVRAEQEKRLARAERDLARLGKINPLALEEHAALEERHAYVTGQLEDLKKTRNDLLRLVRDLDERVEEVMASAIADVSERFVEVFGRLFPGGEGRLVVTDPENILTTGVDIEARPPGKRVKRLSLLSGGERSLTAIAFLVAIFMARPSPFYVMDEVEAALDDVNLSRLLEVFAELQHSSQLLVVTHQKRTMEIADTLYGVTMKEQGVSTVLSQRMRDVVTS